MRKGRVTDTSVDTSWGVTSHTPLTADAQTLVRINRGHWTIENSLHRILDDTDAWNEDNSRIRTGHGPENMTRLRRFAIAVIKTHGKPVTATLRKLHRCPRLLLDYLKIVVFQDVPSSDFIIVSTWSFSVLAHCSGFSDCTALPILQRVMSGAFFPGGFKVRCHGCGTVSCRPDRAVCRRPVSLTGSGR